MQNSACLNCNNPISGKFCSECGQKTDTHRITAQHFVVHDLLHGVFHIEKGMLFTVKQVFIRPGYAARDYIYGKRVRFYNVFYLMLIILGGIIFFGSYLESGLNGAAGATSETSQRINQFLDKYIKLLYLAFVPLIAFNGFVIFRKLKYNFLEHLIISGFACLSMFIIILLNIFLTITFGSIDILDNFLGIVCFFIPGIVYYQVTGGIYKLKRYLVSIVLFYIMIAAELAAIAFAFKFLLKSFAI